MSYATSATISDVLYLCGCHSLAYIDHPNRQQECEWKDSKGSSTYSQFHVELILDIELGGLQGVKEFPLALAKLLISRPTLQLQVVVQLAGLPLPPDNGDAHCDPGPGDVFQIFAIRV